LGINNIHSLFSPLNRGEKRHNYFFYTSHPCQGCRGEKMKVREIRKYFARVPEVVWKTGLIYHKPKNKEKDSR
jgi:hypothetical protein